MKTVLDNRLDVEAYDSLPPRVRLHLAGLPCNFNPRDVRRLLDRGCPEEKVLEIVGSAVAAWSAEVPH